MIRDTLASVVASLEEGRAPTLSADDFPCFAPGAAHGNPYIGPQALQELAQNLTQDDVPTFRRALAAIDAGEIAWLGFKVVYDAESAMANTDNEVTKKYGQTGSADGRSLAFFCNDEREVVASRDYSPRDFFQMKDVTRGPAMHTQQFPGLTWCSVPLFEAVRVWLLGASDSAVEVAALARHVGFDVMVVDDDAAYLSAERFPDAERILLESFDCMEGVAAGPSDYVCVLTRGHAADPQACAWAVGHDVHYVGMMGCAGKNSAVYEACRRRGVTDEQWDSIKRPIGLRFGAKTPAELAIAIVGELVDVRYRQRYSQEARDAHDASLGR